jgi:protoporphyrin/coproporphyrin ferrochelatase
MRTGVLCIQLGTPDAPTVKAVRPYLRQFLSDPRVLDMPALSRWMLLNLVILPFRPRVAAHAYSRIWTSEGSPLAFNTQRFTDKLQASLGKEKYHVVLGMRYGRPSLADAIEKLLLEPLQEVILFPLYPQYASASTGSCLEEAFSLLGQRWNIPPVRVIPPFFDQPGFIQSFAERIRPALEKSKPDTLVFSYHSIPERQILKSAYPSQACLQSDDSCCAAMNRSNGYCYRAQCFATSRALIAALGLKPEQAITTFQSRLGRIPWIKPYTDIVLQNLPARGKKNIAIVSPSFTADCLETLEELGMRGRDSFMAAGGEAYEFIPCINDSETFVSAATSWINAYPSTASKNFSMT